MKAGGTYVPLDPVFPRERLAGMHEDSKAQVLLTRACWQESLPPFSNPVLLLDEELDSAADVEPAPGQLLKIVE